MLRRRGASLHLAIEHTMIDGKEHARHEHSVEARKDFGQLKHFIYERQRPRAGRSC
jgi:hypothetical protein